MKLTDQEIARYKRHILLSEIGEQGQLALKKARVLVIGAGGLGNAVLPYLAAAGLGQITIVDFDVVDVSNLQRQVLFTENDLGKPKSRIAADRIKAINSHVLVNSITQKFTLDNCVEIAKNHTVIVDCVDQNNTRYLVNDVSVFLNIPLVYGAIHKFEGQVAVFNFEGGATYRCAFPEDASKAPAPSCEDIGVVGVLPGIIGMYQAIETIKIMTAPNKVLKDEIMLVDVWNNTQQKIKIQRNKSQVQSSQKVFKHKLTDVTLLPIVDIHGKEIPKIIENHPDILIIDIRPESTVESMMNVPVMHIPIYQFEDGMKYISTEQTILLYCAHGINSQWATQYLHKNKYQKIYHLVGGIASLHE